MPQETPGVTAETDLMVLHFWGNFRRPLCKTAQTMRTGAVFRRLNNPLARPKRVILAR